jgi:general secretion pathway protein M
MDWLLDRAVWPWLLVVLLACALAAAWPTLADRQARAGDAARAARADLEWLQAAVAEAGALRARRGDARPRDAVELLAVVDARGRGSPVSRWIRSLEPEGDTAVALVLQDAVFEELLLWLADIEAREGLRVRRLVLDRAGTGRVSGRLVLSGSAP